MKTFYLNSAELCVHTKNICNSNISEERKNDNLYISCDTANSELIVHSNVENARLYLNQSAYLNVNFKISGDFEYCIFRITSDNPSHIYYKGIIYPGESVTNSYAFNTFVYPTSENNSDLYSICIDFAFSGHPLVLNLSKIEFAVFSTELSTSKSTKYCTKSKTLQQYISKSIVDDVNFLLHPEPHSQERGLALLQFLNTQSNFTCDLGCGQYPLMTDLSLRKGVERIDCVIYETESDSEIHRLLSLYKKKFRIYSDSITKLNQLKNKQYDQILLIDVLEHVQEDQKALANITNILKDEGKLIISVPNHSYKSVFSEDFHNYVGHVRDGYSYDDMEQLLSKVGLEIESFFNYGVITKDYYYEFYSKLHFWDSHYKYSQDFHIKSLNFLDCLLSNINSLFHTSSEPGISNMFLCRKR